MVFALFIKERCLGKCTGISFMDSTTLKVSRNQRIHSHKVFKGIAERDTFLSKTANEQTKTRQYLYKIETGKVTPSIFTIAMIALALEISLSELLEEVVLE